jgi:hypothetical protein
MKPYQLRFIVAVLQRWWKKYMSKSRNKKVSLPSVNGRLHNEDFCHAVANNISDNMLKTAFKLVH